MTADDTLRWLYVTASSRDEALKLGRALVEARLAACANVWDGVTSVYWWQGRAEEGAEAVLVAKTRASLVAPAVAEIKRLHSYSLPCVVALPIVGGNGAFLDWIRSETREP